MEALRARAAGAGPAVSRRADAGASRSAGRPAASGRAAGAAPGSRFWGAPAAAAPAPAARCARPRRARPSPPAAAADDKEPGSDSPEAAEAEARAGSRAVLDDVNPIALGRRSRAFVDGVLQRAAAADDKAPGSDSPATPPARGTQSVTPRRRAETAAEEETRAGSLAVLEDVNPVSLGRRSRAFVDDVWQRVLSLGSTRASGAASLADSYDLERRGLFDGAGGDFPAPQAANNTVLVVGATGRVGTILVRKLSLRGYTVRALVRNAQAADGCVARARSAARSAAQRSAPHARSHRP